MKCKRHEIERAQIDVANLSDQAVSSDPTHTETAAYQDREALLQLLSQPEFVSSDDEQSAGVQGLAGAGNKVA